MDNEIFNDHISQGIALMSATNYPAAKAEFEEAIRINVRSAEAYTHLGNACANLGELDEALAAFKNALVVEPNSAETLFSIASIYLMKNDRVRVMGRVIGQNKKNTKLRHKSSGRTLMESSHKKEEDAWTLKNRLCFTK